MSSFDVHDFLSRPLVARVATAGPTVRPVWFLWEENAFWWLTGAYARLERRLAEDPTVALVVDTCDLATGQVLSVTCRGTAEVVALDRSRAVRKLTRHLGPRRRGRRGSRRPWTTRRPGWCGACRNVRRWSGTCRGERPGPRRGPAVAVARVDGRAPARRAAGCHPQWPSRTFGAAADRLHVRARGSPGRWGVRGAGRGCAGGRGAAGRARIRLVQRLRKAFGRGATGPLVGEADNLTRYRFVIPWCRNLRRSGAVVTASQGRADRPGRRDGRLTARAPRPPRRSNMSLPLSRRIARAALLVAATAAPVVGAAGAANAVELPAGSNLGGLTALDGEGLGNTVDGAAQGATGAAGKTGSEAVGTALPAAGKTLGQTGRTVAPAAQDAAGTLAGSAGKAVGDTAGSAAQSGLPGKGLPVGGLPIG